MKVHNNFTDIHIPGAVVTTGSFDGVHLGHQAIIRRLITRAQELKGASVLITFFPHPRKVLYPDTIGKELKMISSQEEKIKRLEELGLDHLVIVDFTLEFSRTSSIDFIRKYLVSYLKVKHVIIGFNHHFGHNREGDLEYLTELGNHYDFSVEEIPEQDIYNESVSSTKIRKALSEGYIQRANAYLDHPYQLSGLPEADAGERSQGIVHITAIDRDKLLPPPGVYAISCQLCQIRVKGSIWLVDNNVSAHPSVVLALAEDATVPIGEQITIDFHKRLDLEPSIRVPDPEAIAHGLVAVQELIY